MLLNDKYRISGMSVVAITAIAVSYWFVVGDIWRGAHDVDDNCDDNFDDSWWLLCDDYFDDDVDDNVVYDDDDNDVDADDVVVDYYDDDDDDDNHEDVKCLSIFRSI